MPNNQKLLIYKSEMILIKNSITAKDIDIYGNLYDALDSFEKLTEIDFINKPLFDEKARTVILNNKDMLIQNIKDEWSAVGYNDVIDEDIHCQLCGRKNKLVFYIHNRHTDKELNVGSDCINKFSDIENLNLIKKNHMEIKEEKEKSIRRVEFSGLELEDVDFVKRAEHNLASFQLMLPYDLYDNIKSTIHNLNFMKTNYIKNGGDLLELTGRYKSEKNEYTQLWKKAKDFYNKNKNNKLNCKKNAADWLYNNNKEKWLDVAKNKGRFTSETLKFLFCREFVNEYLDVFRKHLIDTDVSLLTTNESYLRFMIKNTEYRYPLYFYIPISYFMKNIGCYCLTSENYKFSTKQLDKIIIENTDHNFEAIYNRITHIIQKMGYDIWISDKTNYKYYVKYSQLKQKNKYSRNKRFEEEKYIRFTENALIIKYTKVIFGADEIIEKMLDNIFRDLNLRGKWLSKDKMKQDEDIAAEAASMQRQKEFIPY